MFPYAPYAAFRFARPLVTRRTAEKVTQTSRLLRRESVRPHRGCLCAYGSAARNAPGEAKNSPGTAARDPDSASTVIEQDGKSPGVRRSEPVAQQGNCCNSRCTRPSPVTPDLRRIMFQQYPQNDVNEPILLHEGRFCVRAGDRCIEPSGSAHLRWLPSPGIEFDIETDEPYAGFDLDSLTVELPGFRTKNVVPRSTHLGSTLRIRAFAGAMEWVGEQSLLSAGFQIVNFTDFLTPGPSAVPGDPTAIAGDSGTIETVDLKHDGWLIRLVAVPESRDRYGCLKASGGYAFTHVGQLTRIDDSAFFVEQAKDVLESLRVFLSFARGTACSLPIQWGRGVHGEIVWRQFGSPIVDGWKTFGSWFDEHHGEILAELFDPFCRSYTNQKFHESLVMALHWYRHCNTSSSGMEGSIVLGMAALELLGALIVVDRNGSVSARQYNGFGGARKLQELLSALEIQADIPHRYEALTKFAKKNGNWDSCQALAKLRNGFVHAKEKNRRLVFGADGKAATFNAWQLSLWYQELALLHLLEHRGSYRNRTTAEWVGQVEPVPWSE